MRFGDPECQGLMMRCDSDLTEALLAATQGEGATGGVGEHGAAGAGGQSACCGLTRARTE